MNEAADPVATKDLSEVVSKNMGNLSLKVCRWTGRKIAKDVQVSDDNGKSVDDLTTSPQWTLDRAPCESGAKSKRRPYIHDLFQQIDANAKAVELVKSRYTTSDSLNGLHLISISRATKALQELARLRQERLKLARQLANIWDSEIVPKIQALHASHWESVKEGLPSASELMDKFDIQWELRPLTPLTANDLDLSQMTTAEAAALVESSNEMLKKQLERRVDAIVQKIFGEMGELCDKVLSGSLATGKCRAGSIRELMDGVSRLSNFGELSNEAIQLKAEKVEELLKDLQPEELNKNANKIQDALKAAVGSLSEDPLQGRSSSYTCPSRKLHPPMVICPAIREWQGYRQGVSGRPAPLQHQSGVTRSQDSPAALDAKNSLR